MFNFVRNILFKNKNPPFPLANLPRDPVRYEYEKEKARSDIVAEREKLASDPKTHPEILYYLAQSDPSAAVRRAVANNPSTPVQASLMIAEDDDADVRLVLAERLVRLLPHLTMEEHSALYAHTVQALGMLALDEVLKIRKALSATLQDKAYAPPAVVSTLARDIERTVAEPILRFCAAVPDDVLIDILKTHPDDWVSVAIAGRHEVADNVAVAVIDYGTDEAGRTLISNPGAQIGPTLLEAIIEKSRTYPEWQHELATHRIMPPDMAERLAAFAGEAVRLLLIRSGAFDRKTTAEVAEIFKRRRAYTPTDEMETTEDHAARATRLYREGRLDDDIVSDALAMKDLDFVYAAIAVLAGTSVAEVQRIFGMRAPKPIVALCWKAGLGMRLALRLQQEPGRVPMRELLYPKGGTDYPLEPEDLRWQLEFLGLA